ncbi:MAG: DEAD/DEAH box helicase [Chloroflexota bacterium]|nr:MAG: DEAD/DEAH box helicase [Chloroflexota bacterium]
MSLNQLLSHWRAESTIYSNITEWRNIDARFARLTSFPEDMHPALVKILDQRGISSLYEHQLSTWNHTKKSENVILATGTASGKSFAYNLPILDALLRDEKARALYIFPTKALSQDQFNELSITLEGISELNTHINLPQSSNQLIHSIKIGVYDGDTKQKDRPKIREHARIILSNPDMLHMGILPHHTRWAEFFANLKFIVIDEIHAYRGVFGSHVANVFRRLRRITDFYGSNPQFFLTSATIANPVELGRKLIEEPVQLVDQDGSSRGKTNFIIYNPPIVNEDLGLRRSSLLESVRLAEDLFYYDIQTIIFGRSRRNIELILTYLRQSLPSGRWNQSVNRSEIINNIKSIRGYRSGYLPAERRAIEAGLRTGKVKTVVATNALELGIDIGAMGASILAGYPGSIASTWQQAGRAGRGDDPSLVVMVASSSPLDQFLAHNPGYFFDRSPEKALINPDNLLILLAHLRCALFELPFQAGENFGELTPEQVQEFFELLIAEGVAHESGGKYFWLADRYPADNISLRVASPMKILIQIPQEESWVTIGEVDYESSSWLVHPHAIYLQESEMFLVTSLDLEKGIARLQPTDVDYYTVPKVNTSIETIAIFANQAVRGGEISYGEVSVISKVTGFRQVKWFTHEQLGFGDLDLPQQELHTMGFWLSIDQETVEQLRQNGLWSSDPNRYGSNWIEQRNLARARDNYQCQVCGNSEIEREHDVHHKTPFRQFQSFLEANQLQNLITLCPTCHRRVETVVKLRSGLSGLAYLLNNIAPLFLMCDSRDLGVYSEPQSQIAHGNPAIVLFERIPAGIGFSQRLFEIHNSLVLSASDVVESCKCRDGCPSCVGPAGEIGIGGKKETSALIALLKERNINS